MPGLADYFQQSFTALGQRRHALHFDAGDFLIEKRNNCMIVDNQRLTKAPFLLATAIPGKIQVLDYQPLIFRALLARSVRTVSCKGMMPSNL
jgi:hypothetical protein